MSHNTAFAIIGVIIASTVASLPANHQTPSKRIVTLSITSPAFPDPTKGPQVMTLEGEMASFGFPDGGPRFGLTPALKKDDERTMVVTIHDPGAKPAAELGKIEVPVGGDAVATKTKPPFSVKVLSVK